MARRRDKFTQTAKRYEERTGRQTDISRVKSRFPSFNSEQVARGRMRGRRGVRARARLARIQARQTNVTYRQPIGGTITNS